MTPSQPSPEHKIPDPWLEKRSFFGGGGATKKCGQSKAKAQRWASHQSVRSVPHCQDNLEKTCLQLLPQPQEGLTSHSLTHCPAPDTALYVTASFHSGRRRGRMGACVFDVRKHIAPRFSSLLTVFPSSKASIFSPLLCAWGRENEDKGKVAKCVWRSGSR